MTQHRPCTLAQQYKKTPQIPAVIYDLRRLNANTTQRLRISTSTTTAIAPSAGCELLSHAATNATQSAAGIRTLHNQFDTSIQAMQVLSVQPAICKVLSKRVSSRPWFRPGFPRRFMRCAPDLLSPCKQMRSALPTDSTPGLTTTTCVLKHVRSIYNALVQEVAIVAARQLVTHSTLRPLQ